MGWTVRGPTAGGDEDSVVCSRAYLVFCTMVTDSLPEGKRPRRGAKILVRMGYSCTSACTGMSWLSFTNQYRLMLFRFALSLVSQYNCLSKIVQVFQVIDVSNTRVFKQFSFGISTSCKLVTANDSCISLTARITTLVQSALPSTWEGN